DDRPAGFDAVRALEQGRIADHAVVDQRFVAGARLGVEVVAIAEIHPHAAEVYLRTGLLRAELQRYPFIGLKLQDQDIRGEAIDRRIAKQRERYSLELDRDLGRTPGQRFSGTTIQRHVNPAPIVDA